MQIFDAIPLKHLIKNKLGFYGRAAAFLGKILKNFFYKYVQSIKI